MAFMQDATADRFDVLVIGGGPAGSTAATLLARRGWRVLQVEKERHPRFHIGESLLPANLPLFEELGVLDQVHALGVLKLGADFPGGADYQTFRFENALGATAPHAFQVRRDQFDALLFRHARDNGVDGREATCVEAIELGAEQVCARLRDAEGERVISARYLIDASGRDTFLGGMLRLKCKNTQHQSAAIFAHFRGVDRRPGDDAGNISIYRFAHGWAWFIPLPDQVMSIGCVCDPSYLKQRRVPPGEFLLATLKAMPDAWRRMTGAEILGETRVTGNYSYTCRRMAGPRWLMVGDAYAFVDPIFSSGVYLAMHSARAGAELVDTVLRTPQYEAELQRAFARRIERGLKTFSWFIYRFNSPAIRWLFANPKNIWQLERGVISMLAGDVFDDPRVRRRLHLFKAAYALRCLIDWRQNLGERWRRRRRARVPFAGAGSGQEHV